MKKMVCAVCGSEDVRRDADASWNAHAGQWEVSAIYDHATCEDCGGETRLIEERELNSKEACHADA